MWMKGSLEYSAIPYDPKTGLFISHTKMIRLTYNDPISVF